MKLHAPFMISSRLLPAVNVGRDVISIKAEGYDNEGRLIYRYYIDTDDWQYENNDLKSGVGGGSLVSGMETLLSFLSACAEGRRYSRQECRDSENKDLFPDNVGEWAEMNSDEIEMVLLDIEEGGDNLIEEE